MGTASVSDAPTRLEVDVPIRQACHDTSPRLSCRSHVSFDQGGGQTHDSDGLVEWAGPSGDHSTSLCGSFPLGRKLGGALRVSPGLYCLLCRLRVPPLVHASASA